MREAMMGVGSPAPASNCSPRSRPRRRSPSSSTAAAPGSSRWPTAWPISTPCARPCASVGCVCCMTCRSGYVQQPGELHSPQGRRRHTRRTRRARGHLRPLTRLSRPMPLLRGWGTFLRHPNVAFRSRGGKVVATLGRVRGGGGRAERSRQSTTAGPPLPVSRPRAPSRAASQRPCGGPRAHPNHPAPAPDARRGRREGGLGWLDGQLRPLAPAPRSAREQRWLY